MAVTLYHNNRCGTSRKVKTALELADIPFSVVEYLKHPLNVAELKSLTQRLEVEAIQLVRKKEALYKELELDVAGVSDEQLYAAIAAHPRLLERPIVVADHWAAICRPATVLDEFIHDQR